MQGLRFQSPEHFQRMESDWQAESAYLRARYEAHLKRLRPRMSAGIWKFAHVAFHDCGITGIQIEHPQRVVVNLKGTKYLNFRGRFSQTLGTHQLEFNGVTDIQLSASLPNGYWWLYEELYAAGKQFELRVLLCGDEVSIFSLVFTSVKVVTKPAKAKQK